MGKMQKAMSIFEASLILDKRIKFNAHIPYGLWGLGECYLWRGEWEKSLHYLLEANAKAKHTSEYQAEAMSAYSLGKLFMAMGDYAEAEKHLTEGIILCDKTQEVHNKLAWAFPALAKLYLKQGKLDQAQNLIKAMADYVAKSGNRWDSARVQMLWGMLFRAQGNLDKALQHFKTSFEKQKSLQMEKWDIRGFTELLFEYASTLLDRDTDADRNMAYSLLKQALAIYQRTGAKKKIEALRVMMTSRNIQHEMIFERTPPVAKAPVVVLPKLVSTGYAKLDEMLFGGIQRTQAVLLTSPSCDVKDRLIKQFLATGIKDGEITFHITIYPSKVKALIETFPLTFYLFICNPQADKIIEDKPTIYKIRGVENLNEINIALTTAFRKLSKTPRKTRRICIEIISDVLLQHQALHTRRWLTGLLPELKSRGFTTLAVMDPGMHSVQETRAVIDLFDGEINIHENETAQGAKKLLKIKKMYNQDYSKEELELKD
jgi:tetratricopeptide (TPR) repeat protein